MYPGYRIADEFHAVGRPKVQHLPYEFLVCFRDESRAPLMAGITSILDCPEDRWENEDPITDEADAAVADGLFVSEEHQRHYLLALAYHRLDEENRADRPLNIYVPEVLRPIMVESQCLGSPDGRIMITVVATPETGLAVAAEVARESILNYSMAGVKVMNSSYKCTVTGLNPAEGQV